MPKKNHRRRYRFLVFAKDKPGLIEALAFLRPHAASIKVFVGDVGDPFPRKARLIKADFIISYISPWIIPGEVLSRASIAALNFHPGPPEYPGIGCTNFALYDRCREFGVTAHHMVEKVDTGSIVAVQRFPLQSSDTVASLTERCYRHILRLFKDLFGGFFSSGRLPDCSAVWARRPFRRAELDALCRISPEMAREEVARRVLATSFPGKPGPYVIIQGHRFEYAAACPPAAARFSRRRVSRRGLLI
ncbi:MAG: formyltransferase family protein [Elusimicrobiota bacterium]|jgi:methionyl-tRNA formyltransferase